MSNLINSQQKSEDKTRIFNIKTSLAVAFDRTGTEPRDTENMANDIANEFTQVSNSDIAKAIKNGGLGLYGKTYKLTIQEVCIWIREYLKGQPKVNNPDGEEIVCYNSNANSDKQYLARSKFESLKIAMADGGYIFTEIKK